MKHTHVILKPGKEKPLINRHHWIFSGAVESFPDFKNGQILPVASSKGQMLGSAYFNRNSGIVGRMLSFDEKDPLESLEQSLESALLLRQEWFDHTKTNAYRLVNGEGDSIAGLIIDRYDQVVVLQSGTLGIDKLKPRIVDWINKRLQPKSIYEKSCLPSRKEEGLQDQQGFLSGIQDFDISFIENGLHFKANLEKSQKTGFFLDHREMRAMILQLSKGKRVLNAFSYTGGFSLYAFAGGAKSVDSIDISKEAIALVEEHLKLNGFHNQQYKLYCEDVFAFLREKSLPYDLVILDPPAFAKKKKDVIAGCRGYKDINRLTMQKMPPRSFLLTSSCSHHVDESLFQKVIFQAAAEARRKVRIIGRHTLGIDHPINIFHPECDYLKSLLLYLE